MFLKIIRKIRKYIVSEKITPVKTPVVYGELLNEKKALIIGGSGGIGSAIAAAFVTNGAQVIVSGTNEEKLKDICNKIGPSCKYIIIDVTNPSSFKDKIHEAHEMFGKIDVLVNSAGIHCKNTFGNVSVDDWDNVMNINLRGMYFMSQEFSKYMIDNNIKGHILNVGSASCAKPGWTPYEISKWGVKAMTLGMADKLIRYGITVNCIAPGPVATPMLGKSNDDNIKWEGNPSGRMATAEEVANLAVVMVSNIGTLIVGDTYFISGGSGTISNL